MLSHSTYKDPLSIMLSTVRLNVELSVNAQFCGGWLLGHKTGAKSFHLISHGECRLALAGEEEQVLHAGDLIVFMREVQHKLYPVECSEDEMEKLAFDSGLKKGTTGILCGSFSYENETSESVLNALPAVLVVKKNAQTKSWVDPLVSLIQLESCAADLGSDLILKQLAESLIIHSIRSHIKSGTFDIGILKLIADQKLSKALIAIQNEPESNWTLEQLARESAMSRTAFSTQFKSVSGWTPMEYLTWWRMQKAWSMIVDGKSVGFVAESVGYRSESAFSRIFKKEFGLGPGELRKQYKAG
ncbi:AraC family transcriptional regulator [Marinomonas pollencensis]|uniref:AraC family transcriptional regulator n=1 Tax=Marinomonas pollencensis TaxID=491954 RepID=A0A3E0DLP7_9GAMM|nr:AraC family transcriptional regulator [Marinomonas pollencensis]REG82701.1 AraC family transcriptional regulator [Marinomonas pollencensis]